MHFLTLHILFFLLEVSCRCLAAPQNYTSGRARLGQKLQIEDACIYTPMPDSQNEDVPEEVAVFQELDFPSPSASTLSSANVPVPFVAAPSKSQLSGDIRIHPTSLHRSNMYRTATGFAVIKEQFLAQKGGPSQHVKQRNPIAITFYVLGSIIGVVTLVLCGRTVHHYLRTPRRNLVQEHIDRYNLERELEEIERERLGILIPSGEEFLAHPPPPYLEAPKYEDTMMDTAATTGLSR